MPVASVAQALPLGIASAGPRGLWGEDIGQEKAALTEGLCRQRHAHLTLHSAHFSWGLGCLCPNKHWAIFWIHDLARASTETTPLVLSATL